MRFDTFRHLVFNKINGLRNETPVGLAVEVVLFGRRPKACRGRFRRSVPLRTAEHFKTGHELAHRCGTEQRRIEVRMQVKFA